MRFRKILVINICIILFLFSHIPTVNASEFITKSNTKTIEITEDIFIYKKRNDFVSNFYLKGNLFADETFPYSSVTYYNVIDAEADYSKDSLNNLYFEVLSEDFNGTQLNYTTKIKAKVSTVQYNIDVDNISSEQNYPSSVQKFLQPSEGIQSDDPIFDDLADSIINDETNPYIKAKKVFDYTYMTMDYVSESGNKTALDAAYTNQGVCTDYARLMVAILRAEGIPARTISGYRVPIDNGDINLNNENYSHMWVEFYIEEYGWIPADPTISFSGEKFLVDNYFGELSQYYIPLTIDSPIEKNYEYMVRSGETPSVSLEMDKRGYISNGNKPTPDKQKNKEDKQEEPEKDSNPVTPNINDNTYEDNYYNLGSIAQFIWLYQSTDDLMDNASKLTKKLIIGKYSMVSTVLKVDKDD